MFGYERKLQEKGINYIAGIDEAGRGPLAGPVCVAAVIMPLDSENIIDGIDDSKKLSKAKREKLFDKIINTAIAYRIELIDEKTIDKINILNATKLGMKRCVENLSISPEHVLIDAVKPVDITISYTSIIHGDALSYSIAAASILAKVTRDRFMEEMDIKYPLYGFSKHKGYGTKQHIDALKKYGKCEIHRDSFITHFI